MRDIPVSDTVGPKADTIRPGHLLDTETEPTYHDQVETIPVKESSRIITKRKRKTVTFQEEKRRKEREKYDKEVTLPTLDTLNEYVVEKIIGHKKVRNQYFYLTKWEDTNINPTYEPKNSFDSDLLIQQYWNTQDLESVPKRYKKGVQKFRTSFANQKKKFKVKFKEPMQSVETDTAQVLIVSEAKRLNLYSDKVH